MHKTLLIILRATSIALTAALFLVTAHAQEPTESSSYKIPDLSAEELGRRYVNREMRLDPESKLDRPLEALAARLPTYPKAAIRYEVQGKVVIKFRVSENGDIVENNVLSQTKPILNSAVREAMSHWKFSPPIANGESTTAWATIEYTFKLSDLNNF